jgi:hypothetical protein
MEPTPELIDELYRDKIRAARAMAPDEEFFAGSSETCYSEALPDLSVRIHPDRFPGLAAKYHLSMRFEEVESGSAARSGAWQDH